MSILDDDSKVIKKAEEHEVELKEESFWNFMLSLPTLCGLETDVNPAIKKLAPLLSINTGSTKFVSQMVEMTTKTHSLSSCFEKHLGRPIYTLDCRYLNTDDAIGRLEWTSRLPKEPKPILVFENFTEIPSGVNDLQLVRNVLLHNWKNPQMDLYNPSSRRSFNIIPSEYSVFVTWTPENREKMKDIWRASDKFRLIGDFREGFDEYKEKKIKEIKNLSDEELKK